MTHTMIILTRNGDDRVTWTDEDVNAQQEARALFERLMVAGSLGARMETPTEGTAIREFDPSAREILVTPAVVAG